MIKVLKKMVLFCLCFSICLAFGCQAIFAKENTENMMQDQMEIIEDNIEVKDGQFDVSSIENIDNVNDDLLEAQCELLNLYNEYIEEGVISVTKNGTIIDNGDDNYYIQGGNVNRLVLSWNSFKVYKSKKNTTKMISALSGIASASAICSVICNGLQLASYMLGIVKTIILWVLEYGFSGLSSLCKTIVSKAKKANTGSYGIILTASFSGISAKKQTKSTK